MGIHAPIHLGKIRNGIRVVHSGHPTTTIASNERQQQGLVHQGFGVGAYGALAYPVGKVRRRREWARTHGLVGFIGLSIVP